MIHHILLLITCTVQVLVALSTPSDYNFQIFSPNYDAEQGPTLIQTNDTDIANYSPSLNTLGFPRNGYGLTKGNGSIHISHYGFLYQRLSPVGYSSSVNLTGLAIQIHYSSPVSITRMISIMQEISHAKSAGVFQFISVNSDVRYLQGSNLKVTVPVSQFENGDPSRSVALRIYGPLAVHCIEVVNSDRSPEPDVVTVDDCAKNVWKDPMNTCPIMLLNPGTSITILHRNWLNWTLGGGGRTISMKSSAFKITYSAEYPGARRFQFVYEIWTSPQLRTIPIWGDLDFGAGNHAVLIVSMKSISKWRHVLFPIRIGSILIQGPLTVHQIDIIPYSD